MSNENRTGNNTDITPAKGLGFFLMAIGVGFAFAIATWSYYRFPKFWE